MALKKYFFTLLCLFSLGFIAKPYSVLNLKTAVVEEWTKLPSYEVNCDTIENGFEITYKFEGVALIQDDSNTDTYHCCIDGFGNNIVAGLPELPSRTDRVLLPSLSQYDISITTKEINSYNIRIATSQGSPVSGSSSNSLFDNYSNSTDSLPSDFIIIDDIQIFRGYSFQYFNVFPVLLDASTNKLLISRQITFRLTEKKQMTKSGIHDFGIYRHPFSPFDLNSINVNDKFSEYSIPADLNESILVITTDLLLSSASEFINWKKMLGYNVYVQSKDYWTEEDIAITIRNWYLSDAASKYVIFIGNDSYIPQCTRATTVFSTVKSDFYYSCLDGKGDYLPDVILARIPASTQTQARNAIEKIISYEKSPNNNLKNSSFTNLSAFESNDGLTENSNSFTFNSENIFKTIKSAFNNPTRIYVCNENVYPTKWNSVSANGEYIPDFLRKPNYTWNYPESEIISKFNNGANLIFYRAHGGETEWCKPKLNRNNFHLLNNNVFPIIYSLCCLTGKYSNPNCFASNLLFLKDHGCSTILAATSLSYSGYNDCISIGILNSIWPSLNLKYSRSDYSKSSWEPNEIYSGTIGDCLNNGYNEMIRYYGLPKIPTWRPNNPNVVLLTMEEYIILGDPTLRHFWDTKTNVKSICDIKYHNANIVISLKDKPAIVSFFDQNTGIYRREYGKKIMCPCLDPQDVYISVNVAGAQPLFGWFEDIKTIKIEDEPVKNLISSCTLNIKGILRLEFDCEEIQLQNLEIIAYKVKNGISSVILQDKIVTNPAIYELRNFDDADLLIITISKNNEIIYTHKFSPK